MQKKHSGKMGAIALPVALIAAAVGVLLWMLTGAQGYRAADWTDTDGQRYYRNLVTHQAFAADVDWDGSDGAVIVIPDEVHGYKVTALGGYIGRGVPTAFARRRYGIPRSSSVTRKLRRTRKRTIRTRRSSTAR